jgi:hypothetical protein
MWRSGVAAAHQARRAIAFDVEALGGSWAKRLAHAYISGVGLFIGPLVVWLVKKDQYEFVNDQGKESMNFQITTLITALLGIATACIGIGVIILMLLGVVHLIIQERT